MDMVVPFSPPDISETDIEAVVAALRSGWITTGPRTKQFESELAQFCGTPRCVALSSATAALEMTLRILGIGPGDEVITSAYTYTASASVIHHIGARVILVDTHPGSYDMDLHSLESVITPNTKAIIPVDIGGVMADYETIIQIASSYSRYSPSSSAQESLGRIAVVADGAHSLGAVRNNARSGQAADFTCFSFHAVKNLTTGEGGAVTWRSGIGLDEEVLYCDFNRISLHGQTKDALAKSLGSSWDYDITVLGYKANMTDITAALGSNQLNRYPSQLERRHQIVEHYNQGFMDLPFSPLSHSDDNARSSAHLYMLNLGSYGEERRNQLIASLAQRGVSSNVHYKPLPLLTAYRALGFRVSDYPIAMNAYANEITLPLYSRMSDEQVDLVISTIQGIVSQSGHK